MSRLDKYLTEGINDKGILKACFLAGHAGAGKSYTIKKIGLGTVDPKVVNTDTWTEFLKAYGNDNWIKYKEKLKLLTKEQLTLYLNSILPLWVDGTSSNPNAIFRRQGILKSIGYDTAMIWVDTTLETALERAAKRERTVDPKFIKEMYKKLNKLKLFYSREFRNFTEILNDEGELIDKVVIGAYKKMTSFYTGPLKNGIGIELVKGMRERNEKYLTDSIYDMNHLKNLVDGWYK